MKFAPLRTLVCALFPLVAACSSTSRPSSDADASGATGGVGSVINGTGGAPTDHADAATVTGPEEHRDASSDLDQPDSSEPEDAGHSDREPSDAGTTGDAGSIANGPCNGMDAEHPTLLECTGLYKDFTTKTIANNVRAYDPGLHLWSDGADKARWVYLPAGHKIDTSNNDEWVFPVGTKFWKEFAIDGKRIETRLLLKRADSTWFRTTYRWSSDETTAVELTSGQANADGKGFEIPTQSQCAVCHMGRRDNVLGFDVVALSAPGASGVTIAQLVSESAISNPPSTPVVIPGDVAASAALGYLHANCGVSCHNRGDGAARDSDLFLRLDVSTLSAMQTTDAWTTGMNVPAYYPVPGVTSASVFAACDPTSSIAYYRMGRRDAPDSLAHTQMPSLGTHKVDDAGLALIANWLTGLPGCH